MPTSIFKVAIYVGVLIWATACAYFDPARYARNHRVLNVLGVVAIPAYSSYCSAISHAKVVVLSNLGDVSPTVALSVWRRIEPGLDALLPFSQTMAFVAIAVLLIWMMALLYLPKFRLTVFG